MKQKSLTVIEYAKKVGLTRSAIYMQIWTGVIPKKRLVYETRKVIKILVEE